MFCQYRAAERGDQVFSVSLRRRDRSPGCRWRSAGDPDTISDATPGAKALGSTPWRIQQLVAAPDGRRLAFVTESISQRSEKVGRMRDLFSRPHAAHHQIKRPASSLAMKLSNRTFTGATTAAMFSFRWTPVRWRENTRTRKPGSTG